MLLPVLLSSRPSYSGTAEVEALYYESVAAAGVYDQTLGQNPVAAAGTVNFILQRFRTLSAEDQAAYAQKFGLANSNEVITTIQTNFINRAYEAQWQKVTAEWVGLMEQKKYDEAKTYATQVNDFFTNNLASLPGISAEMVTNYKNLSMAGIESARAHNDVSIAITEVGGLYTGKNYKEAIIKMQQYKARADRDPAFAAAMKTIIPESAADLQKYCNDLITTVVKDYVVAQTTRFNQLISEGNTREASRIASETSEFFKGNPQAKAIADREYNMNSILICERANLDSFFLNNQDVRNAMASYPAFNAAVEEYNRLAAAKDYLGAARLASEWVRKCNDDPDFRGVNAATGGVLLEMCQKGAEIALLAGVDAVSQAYVTAVQNGDMVSARQLANTVSQVLRDYPEYRDILNRKLGCDLEQIARDASASAETAINARQANITVLSETYRQIAGLYSAEVSVNGTVSVLAQTLNQALNAFAQQNAQYMAEIENLTSISLDALIGATGSNAPAGNTPDVQQGASEQAGNNQQQASDQAEQPPANQSGTPPVTNQSEGTNQGNPFTSGSGN